MGGNQTIYQKFAEVEYSFNDTLESQVEGFKQEVFALVMSGNPGRIQRRELFGSKTIPTIGPNEVGQHQAAAAKVDVKDASGNPIDGNQPASGNAYIELYSRKNLQVTYSDNKDYRDATAAVDEYKKELESLIGAGSQAAGSPLAAVSSLFSNSSVGLIGAAIKTSLNLASTSSLVGITQNVDTTFLPGGIYVANLIYTSKVVYRGPQRSETVSMSVIYTIVATSTDLIHANDAKQFALLRKSSLYVAAKQGEIQGWSDVYPKIITLAASGNKIKSNKTASTMDAELSAMPWRSTQEPSTGDADLTHNVNYERAQSDYKNYGRYRGYSHAKEFVGSLCDDVETDEEVKELYKGVKSDLSELKSSTSEEFERIAASYSASLESLKNLGV